MSAITATEPKTPWHVWLVATLALLWNGSGTYTIMMAQAARLPSLSQDEAAYYAAQPFWFVIATDIGLLSVLAAGVALLLRSRVAVQLFGLSLVAIFITNTYDLAAGTSRVLVSRGALIVTVIIGVIAILELVYARAMRKRGVLN